MTQGIFVYKLNVSVYEGDEYELGEGMYGKIGVVGPKRMDYEKVVGTLKTLMAQLDEIFKKK